MKFSQEPWRVGNIYRKSELCKINSITQSHPASKYESQDSNPGLIDGLGDTNSQHLLHWSPLRQAWISTASQAGTLKGNRARPQYLWSDLSWFLCQTTEDSGKVALVRGTWSESVPILPFLVRFCGPNYFAYHYMSLVYIIISVLTLLWYGKETELERRKASELFLTCPAPTLSLCAPLGSLMRALH